MNSQREAFEKVCGDMVELGWDQDLEEYYSPDAKLAFEVWQAATEQGVGEAVAELVEEDHQEAWGPVALRALRWLNNFDQFDFPAGTKLYTHPPKPTGGCVPDDALEIAKKWANVPEQYGLRIRKDEVDTMARALLATQQPPGGDENVQSGK